MSSNDELNAIDIAGHVLRFEPLELRDSSGASITLRAQTLAVLACLARRPHALVSKDTLMRSVWPDVVVTDDSLVQCIAELRRALNDSDHRIIRTEPKRGYRLAATTAAARDEAVAQSPIEFKQNIRFAIAPDGVRIAYALSGSGPPLVRAPHWMTHLDWDWRSSVFGPRIQAWSRKFTLLRYDARGIGLSDREAMPGPLDQWVEDLETSVDAAGLERSRANSPSRAVRSPPRVHCSPAAWPRRAGRKRSQRHPRTPAFQAGRCAWSCPHPPEPHPTGVRARSRRNAPSNGARPSSSTTGPVPPETSRWTSRRARCPMATRWR